MIPMHLATVATAVSGQLHGADITIDAVATDSRALAGDDTARTLFVALCTDADDGHEYVAHAVANGACAVLAEKSLDIDVPTVLVDDTWHALHVLARHVRMQIDPIAVAITGSVGKTTVKDLTTAALGSAFNVTASRASFNNELGVPLTLLSMTADTDIVVVEVGARHQGDIASLAPMVQPDVAVVTAVAPAHLELFGSIEAIAAAKGELVDALAEGGMAVLHVAWPHVAAMASRAREVIRVAESGESDVSAVRVRLDDEAHAHITVATPWGQGTGRAPLPGRHQVANVLLAVAVAGHLGVPPQQALDAIAKAPVSPMRGDVYSAGSRTIIDDAYNANPTSMAAALDMLVARAGDRPTVAVLGEMAELGQASLDAHIALGRQVSERGISQLVVCGAAAEGIAVGARQVASSAAVSIVDDVEDAARWLSAHAPDDAVILVKASRSAGLDGVVRRVVGTARSVDAHQTTTERTT